LIVNRLIHCNNILIANDPSLDDIPGFANYRRISKFVQPGDSVIDRSGIIKNPFKTKIISPIPSFNPNFNLSYADCAMLHMEELDKLHNSSGKKFRLWYSGGIDSTGILASFIKYYGLEKASQVLEIFCSIESINENPWAWDRYIRKGKFKLIPSTSHASRWDDDVIILNGEVNDQLFGGPSLARYKKNKDLYARVNIEDYIGVTCGGIKNADSIYFAEMMIEQARHAPIPVENSYQMAWWYGFSLLFHTNMVKLFTQTKFNTIPARYITTDLDHFYGTELFQQWSLKFHYDYPDQYCEWERYKQFCKNFILDALDIPEYADKIKHGSFTRIMTKRPVGIALDEDFNVIRDIELIRNFAEPNNSFL